MCKGMNAKAPLKRTVSGGEHIFFKILPVQPVSSDILRLLLCWGRVMKSTCTAVFKVIINVLKFHD